MAMLVFGRVCFFSGKTPKMARPKSIVTIFGVKYCGGFPSNECDFDWGWLIAFYYTFTHFFGATHVGIIYIYTWNLFVLSFGSWTLQKKAFSNQNKGHLGSRYIYIFTFMIHAWLDFKHHFLQSTGKTMQHDSRAGSWFHQPDGFSSFTCWVSVFKDSLCSLRFRDSKFVFLLLCGSTTTHFWRCIVWLQTIDFPPNKWFEVERWPDLWFQIWKPSWVTGQDEKSHCSTNPEHLIWVNYSNVRCQMTSP